MVKDDEQMTRGEAIFVIVGSLAWTFFCVYFLSGPPEETPVPCGVPICMQSDGSCRNGETLAYMPDWCCQSGNGVEFCN